jgi:hypothetical protein
MFSRANLTVYIEEGEGNGLVDLVPVWWGKVRRHGCRRLPDRLTALNRFIFPHVCIPSFEDVI